MHTNSKLMFQKYVAQYISPGTRVLEIGPDGFPSSYRSMVENETVVWHTLDLYANRGLTYRATSEYAFPIQDNAYDVVLSGNVFEHVPRVWVWMRELARVCKVEGYVITISPVSWPYHEVPIDCWRAFPEGMKAVYREASLEVVLSIWESLERVSFKRRIPGRSPEWQSLRLRLAYSLLGRFGFPVECAFDTVTIGRKVTGLA